MIGQIKSHTAGPDFRNNKLQVNTGHYIILQYISIPIQYIQYDTIKGDRLYYSLCMKYDEAKCFMFGHDY